MNEEQQNVTLILNAVDAGKQGATEELFEILYSQLRRMAQQRMTQEKPGQTLQATALVNEAFLRLMGPNPSKWENRNHFFSAAAEAMRRILIDIARQKRTKKKGGELAQFELQEEDRFGLPVADEVLDLDAALTRLDKVDPVKAKLVKLRFFAGFSTKEAAEILGIGLSTAERYWAYAKAWLHQELSE